MTTEEVQAAQALDRLVAWIAAIADAIDEADAIHPVVDEDDA